jgi:hypothetical protein
MARYDLTSLSSQDFEELIRDLLQAEWNVPLEAFRRGRDHGIDLRYAPAAGATIVQCKHYVGSFAKLLAHLRDGECRRSGASAPARYVVATSVSSRPATWADRRSASAFVLWFGTSGADDIEGLLAATNVERANFAILPARACSIA